MKQPCGRCGKQVDKLIAIGDAHESANWSARYSAMQEAPLLYPCTEYVCVSCAKSTLGITDQDLIREERQAEINTEFLLNLLKGRFAQVVIEIIFQRFGYEVYPFGYESYLTNIVKFMRKGDANIPARKMRSSPDLFVYDREYNDGYFLEVKATNTPDETECWISQSTLRQYKLHWPEAFLTIYCIPSMCIYCRQVDEIVLDELQEKESPKTGYSNYVLNLVQDFHILPERFRLIDQDGYEAFLESLRGTISRFGLLAD